mgnify:CR=1 FL=1
MAVDGVVVVGGAVAVVDSVSVDNDVVVAALDAVVGGGAPFAVAVAADDVEHAVAEYHQGVVVGALPASDDVVAAVVAAVL